MKEEGEKRRTHIPCFALLHLRFKKPKGVDFCSQSGPDLL